MRLIRALLVAALAITGGAATAQEAGRDSTYYLALWRQMTGDCGDTQACCMRKVQCLIDLYEVVQRDSQAGLTDGTLTVAMNTMAAYAPVRASVAAELLSQQCPAVIRLSAHNTLSLSSRFSLDDTMATSGEDQTQIFDAFSTALAMYPNGTDAGFLDCSRPPARQSFPAEVTDPTEEQLRRIKAAIDDGDGILAQLYLAELTAAALAPADQLRLLSFRGEAEVLTGATEAVDTFEAASALAIETGDRPEAYRLQKRLAEVLWGAGQIDDSLAAYARWQELFSEDGDVSGAVTARLTRVLALNTAGQTEAATALLEEARRVAEATENPADLATVLLLIPRVAFDRNAPLEGCQGLEAAKAYLAQHDLQAAADVAALEARAPCVDVLLFDRVATAFGAADALFDAGDISGAVAQWEEVIAGAARPLVAEALGTEALASTYGGLAWGLVLTGRPAEAETAARAGLALFPSELWIEGNLAHALLLQGRQDEAREIYLRNIGTSPFDGAFWLQVITDDFDKIRAQGLATDALEAIAAEISAAQ